MHLLNGSTLVIKAEDLKDYKAVQRLRWFGRGIVGFEQLVLIDCTWDELTRTNLLTELEKHRHPVNPVQVFETKMSGTHSWV